MDFHSAKKKIARRMLALAGVRVNQRPEFGYHAVRHWHRDAKLLLSCDSPVIVDGGGNQGDMTQQFLADYVLPKVYVFEANPDLSDHLRTRFAARPNVTVFNKAIGSECCWREFNVARDQNSSSFWERTALNRRYHGSRTETEKRVEVEMTRLDVELAAESTIDLIKLDLEGYELEALKGASGILPRVRLIVTEAWFAPLYEQAPLLSEVELFLRERGFRLMNLYDLYTHEDMQLTAADALFVNQKFNSMG